MTPFYDNIVIEVLYCNQRSAMVKLFILTGIKEVDDLQVQIEIILCDVRTLEYRMMKISDDLDCIQADLKTINGVIDNLKSPKAKIVSLPEYSKLLSEIVRLQNTEKGLKNSLIEGRSTMKGLNDKAQGIEAEIRVLKTAYGNILEFKKRE